MTTTLGTHGLGGAIRWQPAPGARSLQAVAAAPVADAGWPAVDPAFPPLMLTALNRFRALNGARALVLDQRLLASSAYKARHMAQYLYMDHNDPDTPGHPAETFATRITAFYGVNAAAENIAYGDYSRTATYDKTGHLLSVDLTALAGALVDAFGSDVGHRANELSESVAVGFAVAWSAPISGPDGVVDQLPFVVQDYGWDTHVVTPGTDTPPPHDPPPATGHERPAKNDTWVRKTNARATVHVDEVFVKRGVTKVTYTNLQGSQPTTTEARFLELFKFLRVGR